LDFSSRAKSVTYLPAAGAVATVAFQAWLRMRTHPPARTSADLSDRDLEIGCLQANWLHARSAKVYFELLVERYNPRPNCFDWSLNLSREQCESLKRYQKRRRQQISYRSLSATRKHYSKLPRALPANDRAASAAIG
jgi:hypothetical protein